MAKSRHKKPLRGSPKYKRSRILKRIKTKKIEVITRRTEAVWKREEEVARLEPKVSVEGAVSSSWIASIGWDARAKVALMLTLAGYFYQFKVPFKIFEAWYYAHSKGTYFNYAVKDKYPYKRLFPK